VEIPRLSSLIASATLGTDGHCERIHRTELDSHSNMVVLGKNCTVFDDMGLTCTVNTFTKAAGKIERVPILDAVLAYDCPHLAKTFVLLFRNALYIPEIQHNLLPPFIVREAGHQLDECPKFQSSGPSIKNHSLYCLEVNLRIHFGLTNIISFFHTRKPTRDELEGCDKLFLTPDSTSWDPYSSHFSHYEDAMLDAEGEIISKDERITELVEQDEVDYHELPSISTLEALVNELIDRNEIYYEELMKLKGRTPLMFVRFLAFKVRYPSAT